MKLQQEEHGTLKYSNRGSAGNRATYKEGEEARTQNILKMLGQEMNIFKILIYKGLGFNIVVECLSSRYKAQGSVWGKELKYY